MRNLERPCELSPALPVARSPACMGYCHHHSMVTFNAIHKQVGVAPKNVAAVLVIQEGPLQERVGKLLESVLNRLLEPSGGGWASREIPS